MKKILIIHTNGMGDFLMFTPAYKELIKAFPKVEIDFFITNRNTREIISHYPNINKIYESSLKKIDLIKSILKIRKNNYDYILSTTGGKTWKSNILLFFLKGKFKIGEYFLIKSLVFDINIKRRNYTHFVENNLRIIHSILNIPYKTSYKLWYPKEEIISKKENRKIVGIHPGCQQLYKSRRWNKFQELVDSLLKKYENIEVKIFLGPEEEEIEIKNKKNIKLIRNKSLKEVIDELIECDLFINSDSGLGHLYTCFNERIISIFGPNQLGLNQELRTGPYSSKAVILKKRGAKEKYYKEITTDGIMRCLDEISVEEVMLEVDKIMKERIE